MSELIEQHRDELPFSDQITTFDPPKHKAHRGLLMRPPTPKRLKENEDFMWRRADRQIDTFLRTRHCELVGDFAGPFTLYVIAEPLGVPEAHHETFREQLQGGHQARRRRREHRPPRCAATLEFLYDQLTAYVEARGEPWTTCSRSWPRPRSRTGRRPR